MEKKSTGWTHLFFYSRSFEYNFNADYALISGTETEGLTTTTYGADWAIESVDTEDPLLIIPQEFKESSKDGLQTVSDWEYAVKNGNTAITILKIYFFIIGVFILFLLQARYKLYE